MSATVTRSAGTPIAGTAYVAGGGYRGISDDLDDMVAEAARRMAETFGMDVEIRFNSDRHSGGAWLKTPGKGYAASGHVGIGVGIRHTHDELRQLWGPDGRYPQDEDFLADLLTEPSGGIYLHVMVARSYMRDACLATESGLCEPQWSVAPASLDEAMTMLADHVRRDAPGMPPTVFVRTGSHRSRAKLRRLVGSNLDYFFTLRDGGCLVLIPATLLAEARTIPSVTLARPKGVPSRCWPSSIRKD